MNRKNLGFFLVVFAVLLLINSFFANKNGNGETQASPFIFKSSKTTYHPGDKIILRLTNNTEAAVTVKNDCPAEPLDVYRKEGAEWQTVTFTATENALLQCPSDKIISIAPQTTQTFDYGAWDAELFTTPGEYKVEALINTGAETREATVGPAAPTTRTLTLEFTVEERGIFRQFGLSVFYQPLLNLFVLLAKIIPGNNFGWAIIILTIIVRLILFIPTYRSLEQQKSMQELQPKLQALKEKYKNDQQKLGEETMRLYKEHGVNPFGSCLPILIQLPFLWAIFQILQQGLDSSTSFLLYSPLKDFPLDSINMSFLGFNLAGVPDILWLRLIPPVLVGGSQFLTMKLTQASQHKKVKDITPQDKNEPNQMKEMEKATGMMMYFMPAMIAFFAYSYPVGLSLYWFCSTLFGIGQQVVLNRKRRQLSQPA